MFSYCSMVCRLIYLYEKFRVVQCKKRKLDKRIIDLMCKKLIKSLNWNWHVLPLLTLTIMGWESQIFLIFLIFIIPTFWIFDISENKLKRRIENKTLLMVWNWSKCFYELNVRISSISGPTIWEEYFYHCVSQHFWFVDITHRFSLVGRVNRS